MVNILNSRMDFISDGSEFQSLQLLQEKADCPKVVLQDGILQFWFEELLVTLSWSHYIRKKAQRETCICGRTVPLSDVLLLTNILLIWGHWPFKSCLNYVDKVYSNKHGDVTEHNGSQRYSCDGPHS